MESIPKSKVGGAILRSLSKDFSVECAELAQALRKLANELEELAKVKCLECGIELSEEEASEGKHCDRCYSRLVSEHYCNLYEDR